MRIKIFRFLVCLVVICALLINVSPIRAEASVAGTLAAAAIRVTIGILIGLGISTGADTIAHTELAQEAVEVMKQAGYVTAAGTMALTSLGSGRYGVRSNILEALFNWLWEDADIITQTFAGVATVPANTSICGLTCTEPVYAVGVSGGSGGTYTVFAFSSSSFRFSQSGGMSNMTAAYYDAAGLYYASRGYLDKSSLEAMGIPCYSSSVIGGVGAWDVLDGIVAGNIGGTSYGTSYDLTLNFVSEPGISLAEGYPEWAANSVVIDGETYYPVAVAPTFEETQTFTQADVWAGNGTLTDTNTGTGSGTVTVPDNATLKDILTGVLALPQSIAQAVSGFFANVVSAVQAIPAVIQAIPAAITDFFTITVDDLAIPVTWTDFFPFCIPGDIWELVTVLDAEPEAPHFVFDVDFPYMDEPWHIDIDFSAWDPVALVLRRLELLLFVVGLAMATRNYYIRG